MAQTDCRVIPRISRFCLIIICFLALALDNYVYAQDGYVDTHIHLDPLALARKKGTSFIRSQRGPGRSRGESQVSYGDMADNIIALMDKMGVERAVLMPPPQVPFQ